MPRSSFAMCCGLAPGGLPVGQPRGAPRSQAQEEIEGGVSRPFLVDYSGQIYPASRLHRAAGLFMGRVVFAALAAGAAEKALF
nr:hypothetical protein [Tanacetum cinerariifolium]